MFKKNLIIFNSYLIKNQMNYCKRLCTTKFQRQIKNNCIVSTLGSQQTGKTTLTQALKKISAEQQNLNLFNSDIESGANNTVYSRYYANDTQITHMDVDSVPPKNLLTGLCGTDIGLIVIDGSKGLNNQDKDHIIALKAYDIKDIIIYLNKMDLNEDREMRELIIDEIKTYFKELELDLSNDSIVYGSALNALKQSNESDENRKSIANVLKLIELKSQKISRDEQIKKPALFSIKKTHLKLNKGTEVTGFMRQGSFKRGDIVNIYGYGRQFKTKIQEIESFKQQLDFVEPGISAGLLLKSIKKDDIDRGMIIAHSDNDQIVMTDHFKAKVSFLKNQQSNVVLLDDQVLRIYAQCFDIKVIIKIQNESKELSAGETGTVNFKLITSMPLEKEMKFLIKNSKSILGIGVITELLPSFEIEFLNKAKRN